MKNKYKYLLVTLFSGLIFCYFFLFDKEEVSSLHVEQKKLNNPAVTNQVITNKELPGISAIDQKTPLLTLSQELGRSNNLRLFVEHAKKFPEKGGYGYALMAVKSCGYIRKLIPKGHSSLQYDPKWQADSYADRQKVIDVNLRRCSEFSDEDLSEIAVKRLEEEGRAKNDLHSTIGSFAQKVTPTKPEEYKSAKEKLLQYLFDSQDPYAVSTFGMKSAVYSENNVTHVAINNKVFTHPADTQMLSGAWTMAACYLGGDCSYNNGMVKGYCLLYGRCFSDVPAVVKDELYGYGDRDGSQFARAQALAVEIADGIRRKDLSVFQPPNR